MMGVEKEIPPIELLTPLTGEFFPDDSGYDYEDETDSEYGEEMTGRDLADHTDSIIEAVEKENSYGKDGRTCDLMDYFCGNESIKEKVKSAVVSVKNVEGELFGCTTLKLREFLDASELEELCDYITGQYSDGWGEGFEQREIEVDGGTLYVYFWEATLNRKATCHRMGAAGFMTMPSAAERRLWKRRPGCLTVQ